MRPRLQALLGRRGLVALDRDSLIAFPVSAAPRGRDRTSLRLLAARRWLDAARTSNTDENDRSIVAEVETCGRTVLLSGDIEAGAERAVAAELLAADLLKVPHHGSRTSCDPAFLAAVRPRVAIISCGEGNRFGHPDVSTVGRLLCGGARVLRTDLEGSVRVTFARGGAWISTLAHPQPEFLADTTP
jgi:beta-lactamase superfamily II metal-dependent hydrolase